MTGNSWRDYSWLLIDVEPQFPVIHRALEHDLDLR